MTAVGRRTWSYFVAIARPYFTSEVRRQAFGLLALLVLLLLALSGLNVVNSYVGRDFMTALADRPMLRAVGLDTEQDWAKELLLGEQQMLAFARLLVTHPDFAFLDYAASALSEQQQAELYHLLAQTGITYVSVEDPQPHLLESHDTLLELRPDGSWAVEPIHAPAGAPG
jgi:ABC-type uncharacterized transport system fused permease/ATPase subunit